jgi:spermidine synthase
VYVTIALSGACALGAEVIWTRLLGLMLGATVYTFSIILAVFLIGLWGGSAAGSFFSIRERVAKILPEPFTTPMIRALPVALVFAAMFYWLWRVRSRRILSQAR